MTSKSAPVFFDSPLNVSVTPVNEGYYTTNLLPPVNNLIMAFFIICGMFVLSKMFWMLVYQVKYGLGDEYLSGKLTRADKLQLKKEFKGWLKLIKKE